MVAGKLSNELKEYVLRTHIRFFFFPRKGAHIEFLASHFYLKFITFPFSMSIEPLAHQHMTYWLFKPALGSAVNILSTNST